MPVIAWCIIAALSVISLTYAFRTLRGAWIEEPIGDRAIPVGLGLVATWLVLCAVLASAILLGYRP